MTKICPECGSEIIDMNAQFCPKCGVKLSTSSPELQPFESQPIETQQSPQNSFYIPPASSSPSSVQTPAPQSQGPTIESTTKKRSTREWIAICCAGAFFVVVMAVLFGTILTSPSSFSGASSSSGSSCPAGYVSAIGGRGCCPSGAPYDWGDDKCHVNKQSSSSSSSTSSSSSSSSSNCNPGYYIYSTSQGHCCKAGYPHYYDGQCHECASGYKISINHFTQCCPNHYPYYYGGSCWTGPDGSGSSGGSSPASGSTSSSSSSSTSSSSLSPGSPCTSTSQCPSGYECLYDICQKWNKGRVGYFAYCHDCMGGRYNNWVQLPGNFIIDIDGLSYEQCKAVYAACQCMNCAGRWNCAWTLPYGYCDAFTGYYGY